MSSTSNVPSGNSVERRQRLADLVLATLSPLFLLGLWVLATQQGWVRSVLLPSPAAVFATLREMVFEGYGGTVVLWRIWRSRWRAGLRCCGLT